jgi:hypothetical protein
MGCAAGRRQREVRRSGACACRVNRATGVASGLGRNPNTRATRRAPPCARRTTGQAGHSAWHAFRPLIQINALRRGPVSTMVLTLVTRTVSLILEAESNGSVHVRLSRPSAGARTKIVRSTANGSCAAWRRSARPQGPEQYCLSFGQGPCHRSRQAITGITREPVDRRVSCDVRSLRRASPVRRRKQRLSHRHTAATVRAQDARKEATTPCRHADRSPP